MRTIVGFGVTVLLTMALSAPARATVAGEGRGALEEANAALAAQPPRRDAARRALERAAAAEDRAAASEASYRLGVLDEEEQAYARALTRYRESLAAAPVRSGGHWARNASRRMQWLAVRAEDDFAPLARLKRFERDPARLADGDAVAAFARDTDAFPPGIVRAEARTLVAAAWLGPLRRPRDAARLFRLVATDRTADGGTLLVAERGLVDALLADEQLDDAAKEIRLHAGQLDPEVTARVRDLQQQRARTRRATIALALLLGLFALAGGALARRRRRPGVPGAPALLHAGGDAPP